MRLLSLHLKNFRCFDSLKLTFAKKLVLISGLNGAGKTSILEALHYSCYFKSFKSNSSFDLIKLDSINKFFSVFVEVLKDDFAIPDFLTVSIKENGKKIAKLNQKTISSYRELLDLYRIITITENDIELIKGYPDNRRIFIDQFLLLFDPEYAFILKKYKKILKNRNFLLSGYNKKQGLNRDSYLIWSEQLYSLSVEIARKRINLLDLLFKDIVVLMSFVRIELKIDFEYLFVKPYVIDLNSAFSFDQFLALYPNLYDRELYAERSLFGAHLDDFLMNFNGISSRVYGSRGQQKLILFLLKIACLRIIGVKSIFLIDDFMTDFDEEKLDFLIKLMLEFSSQIFVTSPIKNSLLEKKLLAFDFQIIEL